jgi:hypothetical protein
MTISLCKSILSVTSKPSYTRYNTIHAFLVSIHSSSEPSVRVQHHRIVMQIIESSSESYQIVFVAQILRPNWPSSDPRVQGARLRQLLFQSNYSTKARITVPSRAQTHACSWSTGLKYSRLSIIRAWFNRFAAQPRQCIFKEKILFSVSITFV